MDLLTKEQAEYLIEKFEGLLKEPTEQILMDMFVSIAGIKEIINQCTEKECPIVRLEAEGGSIEAFQTENNKISVGVSFTNVKGIIALLPLDFTHFKRFTEGCLNICNWLEEHK